MKTLIISRQISAPLSSVWKVVADVGNYADYAPNIDRSFIVNGVGTGMIRECQSKEGRWQEVCTQWHPNTHYAFQVQTGAPDYPFPFKRLNGKWTVNEVDQNKSEIQMQFDVEFKQPWMTIILYPWMKFRFLKVCDKLLDNWQMAIGRYK